MEEELPQRRDLLVALVLCLLLEIVASVLGRALVRDAAVTIWQVTGYVCPTVPALMYATTVLPTGLLSSMTICPDTVGVVTVAVAMVSTTSSSQSVQSKM